MPPHALSLTPRNTCCLLKGETLHFSLYWHIPSIPLILKPSLFFLVCLSAGHLYLNDGRQRLSEISSRAMSESNVYLNTFHHLENGAKFDTASVESSDSLETSISACSPDNISRWDCISTKSMLVNTRKLTVQISWMKTFENIRSNDYSQEK